MKSLQKQASVVQSIDSFLSQVNAATQRMKQAESKSEAGGYDGGTTHPVKSVDDRLQDAREGSRSSENTADVKEQEGRISVDSSSTSINQGQDETNTNIGLHQSATGEDTSVETESAKGGKEDASQGDKGPQGRGKTTHPARTDNDALDGSKYSSAQRLLALIKEAEDPGRDLVARIAVEANGALQQRAKAACESQGCGAKGGPVPAKKDDKLPPKTAAEQDAEDAGSALADTVDPALAQKQAAVRSVVESIAFTIQESRDLGTKTAEFLNQFFFEYDQMQKQAAGGPPMPPPEQGGGDPGMGGPGGPGGDPAAAAGAGAGAPPPGNVPGAADAAGAMGPGGGGGDEEALIEALLNSQGGGEGGGGEGGGEGGEGGMQISPEDIAMLEHILAQAKGGQGASPEELEAKATAKAAQIISHRQKYAGAQPSTWRPKNAAEARRYQAIAKYVSELLGS